MIFLISWLRNYAQLSNASVAIRKKPLALSIKYDEKNKISDKAPIAATDLYAIVDIYI